MKNIARKQILTFLSVTFLISWILMGIAIVNGGIEKSVSLIILTMWVPVAT